MLRRFRNWYMRSEPLVLVSILLVVLGVWGFSDLAGEVVEGDTQAFDEWMLRVLRNPDDPQQPLGPRWLQDVARDVTALGGFTVLSLFTFTIAGFLWLDRKYRMMWFVLLATHGGLIVGMVLKYLFQRPRPEELLRLAEVHTPSFPSAHSMMSAVVYLTLGAVLDTVVASRRLKLYILGVVLMLTAAVGVSRVYLGVHYPTDVLAGWTAGLVWSLLCWLTARYLQRHHKIESSPVDAATTGDADLQTESAAQRSGRTAQRVS